MSSYASEGAVLDIGCGPGVQLLALPERYIPCGIEISEQLAQQAQKAVAPRSGRVVNNPALEGL